MLQITILHTLSDLGLSNHNECNDVSFASSETTLTGRKFCYFYDIKTPPTTTFQPQ